MKQLTLFKEEESESKYTKNIGSPIYEPKNAKPEIKDLLDRYKTHRLIKEIKSSNVSEEEKMFLIEAASRHSVFNYEKIADYYSHASKEMQSLMEASALVIIDFDKAIELGYIQLCDSIKRQYMEEYRE